MTALPTVTWESPTSYAQQYDQACAALLARAHAQSPNAPAVAGYLGGGRSAADALLSWSYSYAECAASDFQKFLAAYR